MDSLHAADPRFPAPRRTASVPALSQASRRQSVSSMSSYSTASGSGGSRGPEDLVETLYSHPSVKIVAFTSSQRGPLDLHSSAAKDPEPGTLPASSQLERTIAVGPFRIYRAPGSVAFLNCGSALQPIMKRSQCWCIDEANNRFVLQIRRPQYWRIELPISDADDVQRALLLKEVFDKILQFEKTECPFQRGFTVELPERPQTPVKKRPWTPIGKNLIPSIFSSDISSPSPSPRKVVGSSRRRATITTKEVTPLVETESSAVRESEPEKGIASDRRRATVSEPDLMALDETAARVDGQAEPHVSRNSIAKQKFRDTRMSSVSSKDSDSRNLISATIPEERPGDVDNDMASVVREDMALTKDDWDFPLAEELHVETDEPVNQLVDGPATQVIDSVETLVVDKGLQQNKYDSCPSHPTDGRGTELAPPTPDLSPVSSPSDWAHSRSTSAGSNTECLSPKGSKITATPSAAPSSAKLRRPEHTISPKTAAPPVITVADPTRPSAVSASDKDKDSEAAQGADRESSTSPVAFEDENVEVFEDSNETFEGHGAAGPVNLKQKRMSRLLAGRSVTLPPQLSLITSPPSKSTRGSTATARRAAVDGARLARSPYASGCTSPFTSTDSFHSVQSWHSPLTPLPPSPGSPPLSRPESPSPLTFPYPHNDIVIPNRHAQPSDATATPNAATFTPSSAGATASTDVTKSSAGSSEPTKGVCDAQKEIRASRASARPEQPILRHRHRTSSFSISQRGLSPLPSAVDLFTSPAIRRQPSRLQVVRRIPSTIINKTMEMLMSPPKNLVNLMLKVAARIAAGEWRGLVMLGLGEGGENIPVQWDFSEGDLADWGDDDNYYFGASSSFAPEERDGDRIATASPKEDDGLSWEVD